MSEWKEYSLNEIASINPTERISKGIVAKKVTMDLLNPYTKKIQGFSIETFSGGSKFKNGDTLVARITPCLENGKTAYVDILDNEDEVAFGSTEFIVLREREGLSDKNFLYYFSISADFRDVAILSMTGSSGRQRVETDVIKTHRFLFPPLTEQQSIASILSSLDDKIDLLHRQNKTLEAMSETLFRKWFVEEAKEEWAVVPLKRICFINNGFAFQSSTYSNSGQKIIRTMNFNNHWIDFDDVVFIPDNLANSYDKYYLKRNDFLLVMVGASLGKYAIVTEDVLPALQNQNMWCFRSIDPETQHYLNFALRSIIAENRVGASGSARDFFQKGVFYEIEIKMPQKKLIEMFHCTVETFFEKIELNRTTLRNVTSLRNILLPKLMSGEVRIKK